MGPNLPPEALPLLAALAGVVALAAVLTALRAAGGQRDEVLDRLEPSANRGLTRVESGGATEVAGRVLRPLARLLRPSRGDEMSRLSRDLAMAGYRGPHAWEIFLGSKVVIAPLVTVAFLQINGRLTQPLTFPVDAAVAVWICASAFWLPNLWLRGRITERKRAIERSLPDAMDLLVTCVEAGLGLDAALERVATEMELAAPTLGDELRQTFLEIQAGVPRSDGLRRLAERTGVEDLKALSAMLIQTEMFGTSVARALRVHADGMRTRRMQQAEERAAMVAVKLTIPLVLCILPSLIAVVMGPAIVSIAKAFMK